MVNQSIAAYRKNRNSSIELFRIIAMFFIVLSHACVHSNFTNFAHPISLNSLFIQWGVLGNLGVVIYVVISGYFLCKKSDNNLSVIRLLLQVWFYSYFLFFICHYGFHYSYSWKDLLKVVLPTIFEEYWFFTAYVVLNLLSPFINFFLSKITKEMHRNLLIVMFVLWVIIPTFTKQMMYSGSLAQMIFFYCIGAYFRMHSSDFNLNKKVTACITILSFMLLFASTFTLDYLGQTISLFKNYGITFYGKESLLIVVCAVGMFALSLKMPRFSNSFINAVASCTFGVYLIHDNPAVRHIIWLEIFQLSEHFSSPYLIVYILLSVLAVFSVSTLIEYLRLKLFGAWSNKMAELILKRINCTLSYLKKLLNRFN